MNKFLDFWDNCNCFKKNDIASAIKKILISNNYNINHLKLLRIENKIANNNLEFEKCYNKIYFWQSSNKYLNINLKSLYWYIHFLVNYYDEKFSYLIQNIQSQNYLKLKINDSKSLKLFLLQKGLFIFLRKLNENTEYFMYITNNELEFEKYTLIEKISLFLKIFNLNIFQIVNKYLINSFSIIYKDNNFKDVKDYYNLVYKIIRKLFKVLKNNIKEIINNIYEIPYIEAILCYEIYTEFISSYKIIKAYNSIIDSSLKSELNIPESIEFKLDEKNNKKIEQYIYKIKLKDKKLKEISLFYYLECSMTFFIDNNIEGNNINVEQLNKFKLKNNLILNFIDINKTNLQKKWIEMNKILKNKKLKLLYIEKSKRYKNKISNLVSNRNTNVFNNLNKDDLNDTNIKK